MSEQTRKYETKHGAAFAMRTHKDNLYLTDLVTNGQVIETGRVLKLDRKTSRWLAQPACGCEAISFDTLGDATCCLANHAMNKTTHAYYENEKTGKYVPVLLQEDTMSERMHPNANAGVTEAELCDDDPWTVCAQCGSEVRASELHAVGCDVCASDIPCVFCGEVLVSPDDRACPSCQRSHAGVLAMTSAPVFSRDGVCEVCGYPSETWLCEDCEKEHSDLAIARMNASQRTSNSNAAFGYELPEEPTWDFKRVRARLALAGAALLALALLPGHASAREYPIIGTPAYNASCAIVREYQEDGSALAYCTEDGETYYYDVDGNFIYDHGIKLWIAQPGWRVAPEFLQIGPGAPVDAR
ncbi:MAG TPA: hypothetical protein VHM25_21330 [Polyangiaceae bacterium]|nr:hypothetical protein [Polyangiaceae bacterium]